VCLCLCEEGQLQFTVEFKGRAATGILLRPSCGQKGTGTGTGAAGKGLAVIPVSPDDFSASPGEWVRENWLT
jgi:hypothetical protein